MEKKTKPTENFNVQKRCEEIHAQYGTSEMANYRLQQMCDKIAQDAFDEGRQSVVENIPKLIWEDKGRGLVAKTIFTLSYIICNSGSVNLPYTFLFGVKSSARWYKTMEEVTQAVNEDYKERIKQALGL